MYLKPATACNFGRNLAGCYAYISISYVCVGNPVQLMGDVSRMMGLYIRITLKVFRILLLGVSTLDKSQANQVSSGRRLSVSYLIESRSRTINKWPFLQSSA